MLQVLSRVSPRLFCQSLRGETPETPGFLRHGHMSSPFRRPQVLNSAKLCFTSAKREANRAFSLVENRECSVILANYFNPKKTSKTSAWNLGFSLEKYGNLDSSRWLFFWKCSARKFDSKIFTVIYFQCQSPAFFAACWSLNMTHMAIFFNVHFIGNIYLEPTFPLFWLEKVLFWRVLTTPKIEDKLTASRYFLPWALQTGPRGSRWKSGRPLPRTMGFVEKAARFSGDLVGGWVSTPIWKNMRKSTWIILKPQVGVKKLLKRTTTARKITQRRVMKFDQLGKCLWNLEKLKLGK